MLSFLFPDFFPFILLCFMNLNFPFFRFSWVVGLFISVYSNSNSALVENQRSVNSQRRVNFYVLLFNLIFLFLDPRSTSADADADGRDGRW